MARTGKNVSRSWAVARTDSTVTAEGGKISQAMALILGGFHMEVGKISNTVEDMVGGVLLTASVTRVGQTCGPDQQG